MEAQSVSPIKVFYCYAHEDGILRERLEKHLLPLRQRRDITSWVDLDLQAGSDWKRESEAHLDDADIILVLLSANFMTSRYGDTAEMARALERHRVGTARVIPILLKPVDWEITPFGTLSPLPANGKPVTTWANQEEALLDIAQGIGRLVQTMLFKQGISHEDGNILSSHRGPLTGQRIGGKYLLGELLGEGGYGQVYKAQNLQLERTQAVKILLDRHFQKREFRERFTREARIVAALDHPNIIHVDDFDVEPARAYLVMPFIEGGTLQDILEKQQAPLGLKQILFYLEHICKALDYAHAHGVVHLDLKPLNLLVRSDGSLLLADFGLSHLTKQGTAEGGISLLAGSPHYMAPEHIQGREERRSDFFSLGVILYQMLTGRLPFEGSKIEEIQRKIQIEWPVPVQTLRRELPPAIENVVAKALAKQPEQRYQRAQELLDAFKEVLIRSNIVVAQSALPESDVARSEVSAPAQSEGDAAEISLPSHPHAPTALTRTMPARAGSINQYASTAQAPDTPAFSLPIAPPSLAGTSGRSGQRVFLRFFQLGLVGLVIVAFACGAFWLANYQNSSINTGGSLTTTVHASPAATIYPSPTATVHASPAGIITEFPLPKNGGGSQIATGLDGNLWFTEYHDDGNYHITGHAIARMSPTGTLTEFPLSNSQAGVGITAGPDGNLWFAELKEDSDNHHVTGSAIGRISHTGALTEFPLPLPNTGPNGITAGPDGNLWFTECGDDNQSNVVGKIGRISPSGIFAEFPLPSSTSNFCPEEITRGPDGNLWFTGSGFVNSSVTGSMIGRVSPAGAVTEFPLPNSDSEPFWIAPGPDGNLWFTERSYKIGRITCGK